MIKLGVARLPEIEKDNTDRNRTSPFAFTGNKFEFRAVGSSESIAFPVVLLNAAVAEALGEITATLRETLKKRSRWTTSCSTSCARRSRRARRPLRGKQLLGRVGEGSGEARAAQPAPFA